jgi:uncharacterized membrane protein YbhN (UPF0104 family)
MLQYPVGMKKKIKIALGFLILAATVIIFIRYAATHPELMRKLGDTSPALLIPLILLYLVWFGALVIILRISLRLFGKSMPKQENLLLNAYSTLINFFGPGQSGPVFRGIYLKKRIGLGLKKYIFATLIYYGFYAVISAFFLAGGSQAWWVTVLLMLAAAGGSLFIIRWYGKKPAVREGGSQLNLMNLGWLFAATAVQMAAQLAIFFIELRSVDASISFAQVMTYTGAANFSLFVALTPGAIGIREAFLVFSQNLHHISNAIIVAANVIDRAVYLLFLGILFILVISLHAKDKLHLNRTNMNTAKDGGQGE